MPPKRAQCQICSDKESKYTCPKCMILYCSVSCYKQHKDLSCSATDDANFSSKAVKTLLNAPGDVQDRDLLIPHKPGDEALEQSIPPLRPLTSLKWPYIPEESAYPDPLKRDDPKQLQLRQYEAIATSPTVRKALALHPKLPDMLRAIDKLRGEDREDALQRALGVSSADSNTPGQGGARTGTYAEEDVRALRKLAEAIEGAVRGGQADVLGLDWGDQ